MRDLEKVRETNSHDRLIPPYRGNPIDNSTLIPLVRRTQTGDPEAQTELYMRCLDYLTGFFVNRGLTPNNQTSGDLAHDVLTQVLINGKIAQFTGVNSHGKPAKFTTWLARVAINKAFDERRRERRRSQREPLFDDIFPMSRIEGDDDNQLWEEAFQLPPQFYDNNPQYDSAEKQLLADEEAAMKNEQASDRLDRLRERANEELKRAKQARRTFNYYLDGLSPGEIARVMGITGENIVHQRLHYARNKLGISPRSGRSGL